MSQISSTTARHELRDTSYDKKTIKSFTDLNSWRESHALVVALYKATKAFPKEEQFGLTNQLRRAAVSITSNIAEGFGRRSANDRAHFYGMARASLSEVQSQLLIARDVDYLPATVFQKLAVQAVECHKVLTGLINATRSRGS